MNPVPNAVAGLLEAVWAGTVRLIDLTHGLDEHSPYWPEGRDPSSFSSKVASTYESHEYFARDVRRKGLGISLIAIVLAITGLYLKIRQIESGPKG